MNSKIVFLSILVFFTITIVPSYGETWKIQIPAGSSDPNAPAHYLPTEISIRPGDKVEWGNADTDNHTVTSGSLDLGLTGIFDSGYMDPGSRYAIMFSEENLGEIKYFCKIHPWMIGIINVVELDVGFEVFHNVGSSVSKYPVDVAYKAERNLVSIDVDTVRKSLTFNFVGKINNDKFVAHLPETLIKNPQAVWINDKQTMNYETTKSEDETILTMTLGDHVQQVKIVGTEVIGKADPKEHILVNQVNGILDKKFYEKDDEIIISGIIQNPVQLYEITLDIISPEGVTIYHKVVPLVDSPKFSETVTTTEVLREFGEYQVKITGESAKSLFLKFEYGIMQQEIQSPLKQMRTGINASDVICNEGLELLMKTSNGKAVCLSESTATIMMQRGWADYF
ncbi:MAG: cupredoxin domain-containing protein [Candidatus Nitrosopumilus sp. bin_6a]